MSYRIYFKVKVEGADLWVRVGDCDANTTWNVRKMITESTGLPWMNCCDNGLCSEVMPHIKYGLTQLVYFPEKYKQYEAKNGWGTVESTAGFFRRILTAWGDLRRDEPELAKLAKFWIE